MSNTYITEVRADAELKEKMSVFIIKVDEYQTELGLTGGQVSTMNQQFNAFGNALDASNTAKNLAKSAVITKDDAKSIAKATIAQYAKTWRANPAITDQILAELMLPPHNASNNAPPPSQPTSLNVNISSDGQAALRWKRNGNISTTIFIVETATSPTGPWSTLDVTTKSQTKFTITNAEQVCFRVTARRVSQNSAPSQVLVLWPSGDTQLLEIAA